eukprot:scaffold27457_cov29-Tisochrysis_lutea.AAC.5
MSLCLSSLRLEGYDGSAPCVRLLSDGERRLLLASTALSSLSQHSPSSPEPGKCVFAASELRAVSLNPALALLAIIVKRGALRGEEILAELPLIQMLSLQGEETEERGGEAGETAGDAGGAPRPKILRGAVERMPAGPPEVYLSFEFEFMSAVSATGICLPTCSPDSHDPRPSVAV